MTDLLKMKLSELSESLIKKDISSTEITKAYLDNIQKNDDTICAYITTNENGALEKAKQIDEMRAKDNPLSPLAGIPAGIKDNICTKGLLTTCASKMLTNFVPPYNASVMEKLSDTVILGKLNMDEFAMGSTTENSYFKITKNPRNLEYVPGGSSGGSAASVAANEAAFALGSDTGGSIRQPAAFCGVVGAKPTYGRVSRYGLVAFASSLDQIGPLTKDVKDNALVMNAICGYDHKDSTSAKKESEDFTAQIGNGIKGMRFTVPAEYLSEGISAEVYESVKNAVKTLEKLGAHFEESKMPGMKYALASYYIISSAEASSNLSRFDGVKYGLRSEGCDSVDELYKKTRSEGFGAEVKRRIMLGSFALSSGYYDTYYKKALQVRSLIVKEFNDIFDRCDFILSPVAPTTAYKIGEKISDPLEMYMGDIYTVPVNIAGLPALSMPYSISEKGLPIGIQLIGKAFNETTLYKVAYALEQQVREVKND